jgi:hypothetical protein
MQKVTKTRMGHPESYKVWSMELREDYKDKGNGASRLLQYIENGDGTSKKLQKKREQNIQPYLPCGDLGIRK